MLATVAVVVDRLVLVRVTVPTVVVEILVLMSVKVVLPTIAVVVDSVV